MVAGAVTPVQDQGERFNVDAPRYAPGISQGGREYFQERCKLAGEKVFKPLTKERGIEILRMRRRVDSMDQWSREDPYGDGSAGTSYIENFIRWRDAKGRLSSTNPVAPGFDYVDVNEPGVGRVRYTAAYPSLVSEWASPGDVRFEALAAPATGARAKYGVTFEDVSTVEDRRRWIAGATLRLVELATGEVVAERTGFMMDPHNGAGVHNGRQPWVFAPEVACPAFPVSPVTHQPSRSGMTRNWVESLLLN